MQTNGSEATSVLGTLYAGILAVDLPVVVVPKMRKCSHYVSVGVADEATARTFAHLWSLEQDLEEYIANARARHMRHVLRLALGISAAQRNSAKTKLDDSVKQLKRDISTFTRRIAVCEQIVRLELSRQFPEADLDDVKKFHVDEEWNVGYMDHSNVGDELAEALLKSGFVENDEPSDLFGERSSVRDFGGATFVVATGPDGTSTILSEELGDMPPEIADFIRSGIRSGKDGRFAFDPAMMRDQE